MKTEFSPVRVAKAFIMAGFGTFAFAREVAPANRDRGGLDLYEVGFGIKAHTQGDELGVRISNSIGQGARGNGIDGRLAPPDWSSRCWAEIDNAEGPQRLATDFITFRNASFVDIDKGKDGDFDVDFGSMRFVSVGSQKQVRIYVGDSDQQSNLVEESSAGPRHMVSINPEGRAKRRLSFTFREGLGFSELETQGVIGENGAHCWAHGDAGIHGWKGCSENFAPKPAPNDYVLPLRASLWSRTLSSVYVLTNHNVGLHKIVEPIAWAGTLRSYSAFNDTSGCYVACYSRRQDLGLNDTYPMGYQTVVVGQVRVPGLYFEGACLPKDMSPADDLSSSQALSTACNNHFEECDPCWVGGDTGGWFGLYGWWRS